MKEFIKKIQILIKNKKKNFNNKQLLNIKKIN